MQHPLRITILLLLLLPVLVSCSEREKPVQEVQKEYENARLLLEKELPNLSKPIPKKKSNTEEQFVESLEQLKNEDNYTLEDAIFKAIVLYKDGQFREMADFATRMITKYGDNSTLYLLRGKARMELSEDIGAINDCSVAYKLDKMAATLCKLNTSVSKEPGNASLHYYVAEFYLTQRMVPEALNVLQKAPQPASDEQRAGLLYLQCAAKAVAGEDISTCEQELHTFFEKDFDFIFTFDMMQRWLSRGEVPAAIRPALERLTGFLSAQSDI